MAAAPIFRLSNFKQQFVVTTDASDVAVRAIPKQNFGSRLQSIAFASHKLNATEIHYSAYERGMLDIVWALDSGNTISKAHTPKLFKLTMRH